MCRRWRACRDVDVYVIGEVEEGRKEEGVAAWAWDVAKGIIHILCNYKLQPTFLKIGRWPKGCPLVFGLKAGTQASIIVVCLASCASLRPTSYTQPVFSGLKNSLRTYGFF